MYFTELTIGAKVIDLRSSRIMTVIALDRVKEVATCRCTLPTGYVHTTELEGAYLDWAPQPDDPR